jgi:hypothetical protein
MDDEARHNVSALFAAATMQIEDAHEASVEGQAPTTTLEAITVSAERLRVAARQAITSGRGRVNPGARQRAVSIRRVGRCNRPSSGTEKPGNGDLGVTRRSIGAPLSLC